VIQFKTILIWDEFKFGIDKVEYFTNSISYLKLFGCIKTNAVTYMVILLDLPKWQQKHVEIISLYSIY